jgi:hypothetical protein
MANTEPRLDNIRRLEGILAPGAAKGWLLQRAGYVDDPVSTQDMLLRTPMTKAEREVIGKLIDSYVTGGGSS